MKKIICAALASGMLMTGWAAAARAQDDKEKDKEKGRSHSEFAEKIKERLGLSDEQAKALKSAWEAEKAAVKPLREEAKKAERKLEEQVRDLASDKDIAATLDQLDANRKAMMAEHQKMESALASALKPYQRAKMRLMMAHEMKAHRGEERGGPHGRGERGEGRERMGERREHGEERGERGGDHERGDERQDDD